MAHKKNISEDSVSGLNSNPENLIELAGAQEKIHCTVNEKLHSETSNVRKSRKTKTNSLESVS